MKKEKTGYRKKDGADKSAPYKKFKPITENLFLKLVFKTNYSLFTND